MELSLAQSLGFAEALEVVGNAEVFMEYDLWL